MDVSPESEARRQRDAAQFLEGYSTIRDLGEGERKVMRLGAGVHHIFHMGLVLRHWTIRDGWHRANDDFISWHMKWFRYGRDRLAI
jgi:hypothetical protein